MRLTPDEYPQTFSKFLPRSLICLVVAVLLLVVARPAPVLMLNPHQTPTHSHSTKQQALTTPGDRLVYLLAETSTSGWTDETRRRYAEIQGELGNQAAIIALFATQSTITLQDISLLRSLIDIALARQDWDTARSHLQNLLALVPGDAWANYRLALLLAIQFPDQAIVYLARAMRDPAIEPAARQVYNILANTQEWTAASCYQLGLSLIDLHEWGFAENAFNAGLVLAPYDWQLYAYRGYVRDQQQNSGRFDYETAIGLAPTVALPFYFLGLHWRNAEPDLKASRDVLMKAYLLAPDNAALAAELGTAFKLLGDNAQARGWFNIAVGLAPEEVQWYRLRAAFFAEANYLLEADGMAALEDAYRRFPTDAHIVASIGYANYLLERNRNAQAFLELALDLDPTDPRTQYYYGLLQQRSGHADSAAVAYQNAVDLAGADTGYGYLAARALEQLNLLP
jgi:Flp pilus assembly protein TadD